MAVRHRDHVDYLDHGHLQHIGADRTEEHVIEVTETIPFDAPPSTGRMDMNQPMRTAPAAGMRPFRTATTLITWSMVACIIHTATIATTTVLCPLYRIKRV
jgi:hypothetical protein